MSTLVGKIKGKLKLSGNREKIVDNVYWSVLGKIVNVLSGLFVGIIVARYLGPESFGLMNYVISYVALFSILANFGLDNVEIRELSKNEVAKEIILGTAFRIRLFFSVITISLILVTLFLFEADQFTFAMVLIYSFSVIFLTLNVIKNYFTAILFNEYVVKTEIIRTIIGAGIKIILLLNNASLKWFIVSATFDIFLVGTGYIVSYIAKVGKITDWSYSKSLRKMLIKESFPLALSGAAVIMYQRIDSVMIHTMLDDNSLGIFSVASSLVGYVIFFPTVISQTVVPLLVQYSKKDKYKYITARKLFMDYMVWGAFAVALLMIPLSNLIPFLYGESYSEAVTVLQIIIWKSLGMSLSIASGQLIILQGIQKYAILRNIAGLLVCVCLNYVLIPCWGIYGCTITAIITVFVSGYISNYFIYPYREIFWLQTSSILNGWRSMSSLLHVIKLK